jgi:hypothetical protein
MNFYDQSGPTPYLPKSNILKVLKRGFKLLSRRALARPIILDLDKEGNVQIKVGGLCPNHIGIFLVILILLAGLLEKFPCRRQDADGVHHIILSILSLATSIQLI